MRSAALGAVSFALLGAVCAEPIAAQTVIKDPATVRACLCAQQQVAALFGTVQQTRQDYENSQKTLADLNQQLETRRAQMDVYNDADVESYKQLLAQSDRAAVALADQATPSYNDALTRYNAALSDYTARCGGKSYDQAVYNSVETGLICAKP